MVVDRPIGRAELERVFALNPGESIFELEALLMREVGDGRRTTESGVGNKSADCEAVNRNGGGGLVQHARIRDGGLINILDIVRPIEWDNLDPKLIDDGRGERTRPVPQNTVIPRHKARAGREGLRSDQSARERKTETQRIAGGWLIVDAGQQGVTSG